MDIREEEPEKTALRLLGMLRILKYKPPSNLTLDLFLTRSFRLNKFAITLKVGSQVATLTFSALKFPIQIATFFDLFSNMGNK